MKAKKHDTQLDGQCCTYGSDRYRAGEHAARDDPASGD